MHFTLNITMPAQFNTHLLRGPITRPISISDVSDTRSSVTRTHHLLPYLSLACRPLKILAPQDMQHTLEHLALAYANQTGV